MAAHSKSKGQGIRVVAGAAANGVVIVARQGSGITSLKDLAGKRIATPQHGNTQDVAARHYVSKVLGQKDTNNILPVPNAEQAALMARNEVDAAWAPEPWGSRLILENGATLVAEEKDVFSGGVQEDVRASAFVQATALCGQPGLERVDMSIRLEASRVAQ